MKIFRVLHAFIADNLYGCIWHTMIFTALLVAMVCFWPSWFVLPLLFVFIVLVLGVISDFQLWYSVYGDV